MSYHSLQVDQTPEKLTIKIPWRVEQGSNKDNALTAVIGLVLMAVGTGLVLAFNLLSLLGLVFVLFSGLFLLQLILKGINTTVVTIDTESVHVRSTPFPFTGTFGMSSFTIPRKALKQVVVEDYSLPSAGSVATLVQVIDTSDKAYKLFQFQHNTHLAYELEDAIESFLGVENVFGAVSPRYSEAQDFLNMVQDEQAWTVAASLLDIVDGDMSEIAALIRSSDLDELVRRSKSGDINDLVERWRNAPTPDPKLDTDANQDA